MAQSSMACGFLRDPIRKSAFVLLYLERQSQIIRSSVPQLLEGAMGKIDAICCRYRSLLQLRSDAC